MLPGMVPVVAGSTPRDFLGALQKLNLTSGLKLCLDAGDAASYTSGQSWLDRSGNGHDFFRGINGSSGSDDPTFNGSAGGLSSSEYFGLDGGDFFNYDSANETWQNNLHKAGALFTVLMWTRVGAVGSGRVFFSTARTTTSDIGLVFRMAAGDGRIVLQVFNGSDAVNSGNSTSAVAVADEWVLLGVSLDSGDGSTGRKFFANGTVETSSGTYSSPSASNASYTNKIGVRGDGAGDFLSSGTRIGGVMAWEGVALTSAQMTAIFQATRRRYGV